MKPQPKITGYSTLFETPDGGRAIVTVKAQSRRDAAKFIEDWLVCPVDPDGMFRTVTIAADDYGNPLYWATEEMDLNKCEAVE